MILSKHIASTIAALGILFVLSSCATLGRDAIPVDGARLGPKRPVESVALRAQPINGQKVAVINSRRSTTFEQEDIAQMLFDLRSEGARAGVDAVANIRILHDWRRGFINNPRTPFPSKMQGQQNLYYLRGDGIRCTNGQPPAGSEPSVSYFATQPLPKGSISPQKGSSGSLSDMMPGSALEAGTAPYLNIL